MPVKSRVLALIAVVVAGASIAQAEAPKSAQAIDLKARIKGAERTVVGRVVRVAPYIKKSDHGDMLIMSHVELAVEETLKGAPTQTVPVEIEGGTLNGVTMEVSDMPELKPGVRAVMMLKRGRSGEFVPHQRGEGVLELDAQEHVKNSDLWLDDVRLAAAESR
jgi:hypothetical protein